MTFDELGLGAEVLKAVAETGYTEPTPIQAQAIPHVLKKRDVLGIAQTGTGKTASFTLPMIDLLSRGRAKARMPRSLILEPTRELAAQVAENFETYGKYNKLSMALLIGGVSFGDQEKKLDRGVDVLIATPGRLLDHCSRGKVLLTGVQILVIDEADRMLDMGFIPDIEEICKKIPFTRQTLFFSATMPPEIQRLTETFLQNPERVEVSRPASASATITQGLIKTTKEKKRDTLLELIEGEDVKNAIIFCNRKRDIGAVHKTLEKHGLPVGSLHGDLDQSTRTKTLEGFRNGTIRLLVASDVAARGLDIPDVSHVFNFDIPTHAEDYVHRIGRTGRAGRLGFAYTLVTREDAKYLAGVEKLIGTTIPERGVKAVAAEIPAAVIDVPANSEEASGEAEATSSDETEVDTTEAIARKPRERRTRGGRGRSKSAAAKTEESVSEDAAVTENATQPEIPADAPELVAAVEEQPATRSPRNNNRNDRSRNDQPRRERSSGGRGRDDDDGPRVIGLGDHVPAFMLRAVKLPKRRSDEAEDSDIDIDETETEEA